MINSRDIRELHPTVANMASKFISACKKAGIARSTLYRWMEDDTSFRDDVRDAQEIGQDTMNDYVEA